MLLSVIWGSAFMLVDVALDDLPVLTLVAGRLVGAALFASAVLLVTGGSLPRAASFWAPVAAMGAVNIAFPFAMLTWGQQHIESSLAAILTASMPLSTAVLAHFFIGERVTAGRLVGLAVGFAGVIVLFGPGLRDVTESSTLGQLAVLGGVIGYSTGTVIARRYLQEGDAAAYTAGQTLVAVLLIAPIAAAIDQPFDLDVSAKAGLAWAALGIVSTGTAYLLFFWLIRRVTAVQMSSVAYLIPVTAVILGTLVLDERLGASSFVGLGLIVAGVWAVNGGGRWATERIGARRRRTEARAGKWG